MIEKKIRYDINIEKPSKTKPVKQGGVLNYLGKQKTVSAPRRWRSSPKHPIAHLAYITKDEEKILVDLDLYNSLKGRPNKGPSGIMSLNGGGGGGDGGGGDGGGSSGGDGSSSGDSSGDSSGEGDSGPGGSDDGSGHGGPGGPGDSGPGGSDDGTGHGGPGPGGPGGESTGDAPGTQGGTVGEAQAAAQAAAESISADNVSTQAQADQEDAATAAAANTSTTSGVMSTLGNMARAAMNAYSRFSPTGIAINAISTAISNAQKGVTGPSDDTQEQTSVQTGPTPGSGSSDGGITTIPIYAPLVNESTGSNTADALLKMYRANLRMT